MNIQLDLLKIRNFKGIKELMIEAKGNDVEIRGDNATGKTTVKDAFTWLLFNKNSLGKTDFGIKPVDKDGNVIHNLEVSVEATFLIDGTTKTFKKTLSEKWTRKRGAATAVFTGHESGYYVNDVPKKKTEYAAAVGEIIGEDVFKIITDPLYFNEQLKWQDRRKLLIEICGDVSDETILASNRDFDPLAAELNGRTVDEYKIVLAQNMKTINKDLEMLPVKINEAEIAKPDAAEISVNEERKVEIVKEVADLDRQYNELIGGASLMQLKAKRDELKNKIKSCINASGQVALPDEREISQKINDLQREIEEDKIQVTFCNERLAAFKEKKKNLSAKWDEVFSRAFTGDECPVCHRPFPADEVEAEKKKFNAGKAAELDRIEAALNGVKSEETDRINKKDYHELNIAKANERLYKLRDELTALRLEYQHKVYEANEKAAEQKKAYEVELAEIEDEILNYEESIKAKARVVNDKIKVLSDEKDEIDRMIAKRDLIVQQDKRIAELKAQQETLSAEYMRLDGLLYLTEKFIRAKVDMLNEQINSHFEYARFKLFDTQINEGIKETCEVTYRGVPYGDLNNAARINVGLDVINTLCKKYEATAPIFIDNAEAVTRVAHTDSQQIRLIVDGCYKELAVFQ